MAIRYRVWDGEKMDDWDGFFINTEGEVLYSGHGGLETLPDHVPLLSTGLEDCNGKEIFEGDVVRYGSLPENHQVIFHTSAFVLTRKSTNEPGLFFSVTLYTMDASDIKIIGNIYENPELAK